MATLLLFFSEKTFFVKAVLCFVKSVKEKKKMYFSSRLRWELHPHTRAQATKASLTSLPSGNVSFCVTSKPDESRRRRLQILQSRALEDDTVSQTHCGATCILAQRLPRVRFPITSPTHQNSSASFFSWSFWKYVLSYVFIRSELYASTHIKSWITALFSSHSSSLLHIAIFFQTQEAPKYISRLRRILTVEKIMHPRTSPAPTIPTPSGIMPKKAASALIPSRMSSDFRARIIGATLSPCSGVRKKRWCRMSDYNTDDADIDLCYLSVSKIAISIQVACLAGKDYKAIATKEQNSSKAHQSNIFEWWHLKVSKHHCCCQCNPHRERVGGQHDKVCICVLKMPKVIIVLCSTVNTVPNMYTMWRIILP